MSYPQPTPRENTLEYEAIKIEISEDGIAILTAYVPQSAPTSPLLDIMSLSSIIQRNTLAKLLRRTTEAQRLPRALVEPSRDLVEFCL